MRGKSSQESERTTQQTAAPAEVRGYRRQRTLGFEILKRLADERHQVFAPLQEIC
jgi:hypothetical protein